MGAVSGGHRKGSEWGLGNWIAIVALLVGIAGLWLQFRSMRLQLTVQNFAHHNERYHSIVADLPDTVLDPDFGGEAVADRPARP